MFEVVLVDDGSSDGTAAIATAAAASAEGRREVFRVLHGSGSGPLPTKGAALAAASLGLRGEIEAALDADTRIGPDFLSGVMAAWRRDPTAAAIQARRQPTNADRSWLTAAQGEEQLMDLASQCGRRQADGTAELRGNGMFVRRDVLRRVGGWSTSAITEDLDLSTRLAAAGEHVALAPEVELGEEAVEGLAALWYQRMRWAEGSLRRLMEHGPGLLAGSAPLGRKADFLAFTTEFLIPPLFVTSIAAALLTIPLPGEAEWTVPISLFLGYGAGTFVLALAGLAGVGVGGWSLVGRATRGSLFLSHWLLVVPAALLWIVFAAPTRRFRKTPRAGHPPDAGDTPGWAVTRPPHGGDGAP
jgi:cellulose synthase/poly-beta-1,6-N-acetylglucosamine synthase-like glycosyltransferase